MFIDEKLRIIDIKENVSPCKENQCPSYPSKQPAKYVLEVNAGFALKNNIKIEDMVSFQSQM